MHLPVMLTEVVEHLNIRPGATILDGTLGLGGHAGAMLERAMPGGRLVGLDRDETSLARAREALAPFGEAVCLRLAVFSRFADAAAECGIFGFDAMLVDLGVSSPQLDEADRGFSFLRDGPLDMRMGGWEGRQSARQLVNRANFDTLKRIIGQYGEEPQAGRIARAIIEAREKRPFETTLQLAACVEAAYPAKWRATARNHPATRTFQALRMAVNDELGELEAFLDGIGGHLNPGGRLAVISFHSLEDRLVKRAFKRLSDGCRCAPGLPECQCGGHIPYALVTKKPLTATDEENAVNPRARSAKLRVIERLAESPDGGRP